MRIPSTLDFSCHPMIFDATSPGKRGASRNCVGAGSKGGFYTWDRYTGELLWKVMLTNRGIQGGLVWNSTAVAYKQGLCHLQCRQRMDWEKRSRSCSGSLRICHCGPACVHGRNRLVAP